MKTQLIAASAMFAALATPIAAFAGPAAVPNFQAEKCYGIAKAGLNDCQTATHSFAGTSTLQGVIDAVNSALAQVGLDAKVKAVLQGSLFTLTTTDTAPALGLTATTLVVAEPSACPFCKTQTTASQQP